VFVAFNAGVAGLDYVVLSTVVAAIALYVVSPLIDLVVVLFTDVFAALHAPVVVVTGLVVVVFSTVVVIFALYVVPALNDVVVVITPFAVVFVAFRAGVVLVAGLDSVALLSLIFLSFQPLLMF
jgi:hypothetical protein